MTIPTVDYNVVNGDLFIEDDPVTPGSETDSSVPGPEFDPTAESETRDSVLNFITGRPRNEKTKRKHTGTRPPKPPKVVPPKPRPGSLKKPLQDMYATIGMTVTMFDPVCGQAIIANAEACATALENMARENEAVRRVIMSLVQTSIWGQLIAAHMPILVAIAMHHVPALRGTMMPESATTVNDTAANMSWQEYNEATWEGDAMRGKPVGFVTEDESF